MRIEEKPSRKTKVRTKKPPAICVECGRLKRIVARGRCSRCYRAMQKTRTTIGEGTRVAVRRAVESRTTDSQEVSVRSLVRSYWETKHLYDHFYGPLEQRVKYRRTMDECARLLAEKGVDVKTLEQPDEPAGRTEEHDETDDEKDPGEDGR